MHLGFSVRRRKLDTPLGWFPADPPGLAGARAALKAARAPARVLLDIPVAMRLERRLTLPLAVEPELERLLAYEMDRLTPFSAAEVWWGWDLAQRDRPNKRLHVTLAVVAKAHLADAMMALGRLDLAPDAIVGGAAAPIAIARHVPSQGARRAVQSAAGVCAVLALAVAVAPIMLHLRALAAVDERISALRPAVGEVEALRRRMTVAGAGSEALDAETARLGTALPILAALTAALPDDTHLTSLTLRQRQLTFSGRSGNAAKLLATLSDDAILRDPTFVSPLTRAEPGGDIFAIRVGVGGMGR